MRQVRVNFTVNATENREQTVEVDIIEYRIYRI